MGTSRVLQSCFVLSILTAVLPVAALAQDGVRIMDRQTFVHLMVDELEVVDPTDNSDFAWDIDLSIGGDLHKFWLKARGERGDAADDKTELQLLYSRAILPFWDLQAGVRQDVDPDPEREWAVIAIRGLSPYFFEVETEIFFAEGGQSALRVKGEYELLLTQRLILAPELELLAYGRDEPARLLGSGLSRIEFDLRLRYELKRELAPYVGIGWYRQYGATRDLTAAAGQDADDAHLIVGLRGWF